MSYDPNIGGSAGTVTWSLVSSRPAIIDNFIALSPSADKLVYFTGATTLALTPLTSFARTLLDDTTAAEMRATLGVGTSAGTWARSFLTMGA